MNNKKKKNHVSLRLNLLFLAVFLLFSGLILRLGVIQIVYGEDYTREIQRTEDVTVNTPVPRGKIYDRNGQLIVDNEPRNAITFTNNKTLNQQEMLEVAETLATYIEKDTSKIQKRDLQDYWLIKNPEEAEKLITEADEKALEEDEEKDKKLYQLQLDRITEENLNSFTDQELEVLAVYRDMISGYAHTPQTVKNENVTQKEFAVVSENLTSLPGVESTTDWERKYMFENTLRSILGRVSSSDQGIPVELLDEYLAKGYSRNDRVGMSYIEAQYEDVLQGQKQKVKNVTDRSGAVVESEVMMDGQRGKDLKLTIDMDLQLAVDEIISKELMDVKAEPGHELFDRIFVTMMDPNTGEVLAMSGKQYVVDEETGKPGLIDFASGNFTTSYNVGSSIKAATVLTGYQTGAITPGQVLLDTPLKIKGTPEKSSYVNMGNINDLTALKRSSNVYMFKTAISMGGGNYQYNQPLRIRTSTFNVMRENFAQFGLGVRTGIDLPGEQIGFTGQGTNPGFILDLSIGQYDTYTPLQLAQYISTIANGGYRVAPRVVKSIHEPIPGNETLGPVVREIQPTVLNRVDMPTENIDRVKEGLRQVMQEQGGTAYSYFESKDYLPAGKTGTAQAFYDGPKRQELLEQGKGLVETWNLTLAGYAPHNNPEVAFSVVVPWLYQRDSQSTPTSNRVGQQILDKYFELKEKRQNGEPIQEENQETEESTTTEES